MPSIFRINKKIKIKILKTIYDTEHALFNVIQT